MCGYADSEMNSFALALLGGQGDLVSRVVMGIVRIIIWVIGVLNLLT